MRKPYIQPHFATLVCISMLSILQMRQVCVTNNYPNWKLSVYGQNFLLNNKSLLHYGVAFALSLLKMRAQASVYCNDYLQVAV
jgi:hypothetical protein